MTNQPEVNQPNQATGFKLSLDGWAVALALVLSLLIWAGLIKRVPW